MTGVAPRDDSGAAQISYDNGEPVPEQEFRSHRHISFHPSGLINTGAVRSYRPPWRDLEGPEQLCLLLFEHPSAFPGTAATRARDIDINYIGDEAAPLAGALFVTPHDHIVPLGDGDQLAVALRVPEPLGDLPGLTVQFTLGTTDPGQWPPRTHFVWLGRDKPHDRS